MVGGRLQSVKTDTYSYKNNNLTGVTSYDETAFSPGFAIVHKLMIKHLFMLTIFKVYQQGI